ncbi:MAG TPA: tetratricopeptide repeat protein [Kofleriaceae bacterium]|nr:tetratricopeptide repeat protein [Kofleriaceae bacterium]
MGVVFASATALAQPGPLPSADFAKQGTDLYRAGDYAGAVAPLEKAVELEPNNFEYRFMLAQSYRQSGHCDKAVPLYRALVDVAPDAQRKTDVETNMALCPATSVAAPPSQPAPAPEPPEPPAPAVVTSSSGGSISGANMGLLMGAGVGIGAGVVLLLSGYNDSKDADRAAKFSDHDAIDTRASTEYVLGAVGVGVGVALGVVAVVRIKNAKEHDTSISFKPRSGGGTFVWERTW